MITAEKKQAIVKELQSHKTDTGSSAVQVGVMTERIRELTEHLKTNQHDFM
ncbi:MAG TPA: 30S ribosomal protein S15, partial [Candidatus Binatia bacterium]|nr:30S ribosomal protein S15 [Candidatus Binatia bacterium]